MFERSKSRDFLTAGKSRKLPQLENLEDRAVPAVISAIPSTDMAVTSANSAVTSFQVNFDLADTDAARTAALAQFNPALGTLTSVDLIATGSTSTHAIMENMGDKSADFKAEVNGDIRYNVAGTILESTPSTTKVATLQAFDGKADLKGTSSHDFGQIELSGTFQSTTLTAPADIAAFIGTGTVDVAQQSSATTCSCGTGNLLSMVTTQASGNVKVVYHYTPATPPTPPTPPPPPITDPPPITVPPGLPSKDLFIFYL